MKHTPTPPSNEKCVHWAKPCVYCSELYKNLKNSHEELLEAAKLALEECKTEYADPGVNPEIIEILKKAIAKAEGK